MKKWDVCLTYVRSSAAVDVTRLNNRLHPERISVTDDALRLTIRSPGETLTDALISALGRVEELVHLPLDAVWAEEAAVPVPA